MNLLSNNNDLAIRLEEVYDLRTKNIILKELKMEQHHWIKESILKDQKIQQLELELEEIRFNSENTKKVNDAMIANINQMADDRKHYHNKNIMEMANRLETSNQELIKKRKLQDQEIMQLQKHNKELLENYNDQSLKLKDIQLKYETNTIQLNHSLEEYKNKSTTLQSKCDQLSEENVQLKNDVKYQLQNQVDELNRQLQHRKEQQSKEIDFLQKESEKALQDIKQIYQDEKDMLLDKLSKREHLSDLFKDINQYLQNGEHLMEEKVMNHIYNVTQIKDDEILKFQHENQKLTRSVFGSQQELQRLKYSLGKENEMKRNAYHEAKKVQDILDAIYKNCQMFMEQSQTDRTSLMSINEKVGNAQVHVKELLKMLEEMNRNLEMFRYGADSIGLTKNQSDEYQIIDNTNVSDSNRNSKLQNRYRMCNTQDEFVNSDNGRTSQFEQDKHRNGNFVNNQSFHDDYAECLQNKVPVNDSYLEQLKSRKQQVAMNSQFQLNRVPSNTQSNHQIQYNMMNHSNSFKYNFNKNQSRMDYSENNNRIGNMDQILQHKNSRNGLHMRTNSNDFARTNSNDFMNSNLDPDFKEKQLYKQIQNLKKQLLNIFKNNNFENFSYFSTDQCKQILKEKFQIQQELQSIQSMLYKMTNINSRCLVLEKKNIGKYLEILNQELLNKRLRDKINNVFQNQEMKRIDIKYLVSKLENLQEDMTMTQKTINDYTLSQSEQREQVYSQQYISRF